MHFLSSGKDKVKKKPLKIKVLMTSEKAIVMSLRLFAGFRWCSRMERMPLWIKNAINKMPPMVGKVHWNMGM